MAHGENPIEALRAMLDAGTAIVGSVLDDPLMARWIDAFADMPTADRAVIVDAVEREVKARVVSRGVEATTAQTLHPNPNSRLYVRVHGPEVQPDDMRHEEMLVAMVKALRVIHLIAGTPRIHTEWLEATRAAVAQIDADNRTSAARVLRELLGLIDAASGAAVTTGRT